MKKAFIFFGAFALVIAPFFVLAAPGFSPIIPEDIATGGPYLQACDAVRVFDNLLRFAVSFAVIVATLMFTYAGFLYVTASANQNNLESAKKIFGNVFLGLLFILGAWLIINVVMNVFVPQEKLKFPWNEIRCVEYTSVPSVDIETVGTGKVGSEKLEAENRALLALEDVGVNKPACTAGQTTDCTNTAGLKAQTIGYVAGVKDQCDAAIGAACDITITGGTEGGHSGGTNPGSHGGGDKVDLRVTPNLNTYVEKQVEAGNFSVIKEPQFGVRQYFDEKTGAVWTYESEIKNGVEVVHYDVCVSNCAAPAARGS